MNRTNSVNFPVFRSVATQPPFSHRALSFDYWDCATFPEQMLRKKCLTGTESGLQNNENHFHYFSGGMLCISVFARGSARPKFESSGWRVSAPRTHLRRRWALRRKASAAGASGILRPWWPWQPAKRPCGDARRCLVSRTDPRCDCAAGVLGTPGSEMPGSAPPSVAASLLVRQPLIREGTFHAGERRGY